MPRPRRQFFAGTVYHVLNRGNARAQIFHTDNDYRGFLDLMADTGVHVPMRVVGYEVMPNHVHLLLWPEDDDGISCYMQRLTGTHALQYRHKTSTVGTGHVYQGRFKCFPVQADDYYYTCLTYTEDNAHRAGLVSQAELWPWSSLYERLHGGGILSQGPMQLPENWVKIVNAGTNAADLRDLRICAQEGRPYGSAEWVDRAVARHGIESLVRPRGRPPLKVRRL